MGHFKSHQGVDQIESGGHSTEALDVENMQALAKGDLSALDVLYVRYRRLVMTVLRRHRHVPLDELEDLCHEVFLSLKSSAHLYRHQASPRAFIAGIAARTALKRGRREALFQRIMQALFDRSPSTTDDQSALEAAHDVQSLLSQLPESLRVVLLLFQVEQLSAQEIGDALHISVNAVWTRLHRARQKIREFEESA